MLKIRNAEVLDNIVIVCSSAYMEGYSGCGECVLHEFMRKGYGLCRGVCVCGEMCLHVPVVRIYNRCLDA